MFFSIYGSAFCSQDISTFAELGRVYSLQPETLDTDPATGDAVRHATPGTRPRDSLDVRLVSAEAELTGARQLIKFLETQVEDLRGDRDGWQQQAEAAQRLLTHAREAAAPPAPARPWWKWRLAG